MIAHYKVFFNKKEELMVLVYRGIQNQDELPFKPDFSSNFDIEDKKTGLYKMPFDYHSIFNRGDYIRVEYAPTAYIHIKTACEEDCQKLYDLIIENFTLRAI